MFDCLLCLCFSLFCVHVPVWLCLGWDYVSLGCVGLLLLLCWLCFPFLFAVCVGCFCLCLRWCSIVYHVISVVCSLWVDWFACFRSPFLCACACFVVVRWALWLLDCIWLLLLLYWLLFFSVFVRCLCWLLVLFVAVFICLLDLFVFVFWCFCFNRVCLVVCSIVLLLCSFILPTVCVHVPVLLLFRWAFGLHCLYMLSLFVCVPVLMLLRWAFVLLDCMWLLLLLYWLCFCFCLLFALVAFLFADCVGC